mgnify:CR=1 FL=1
MNTVTNTPRRRLAGASAPRLKVAAVAPDESIYGMTNGDPVEVEKSTEEVKFLVRAEGYEDYELVATMNRNNKRFDLTSKLVKEKVTTKRAKKKKPTRPTTKKASRRSRRRSAGLVRWPGPWWRQW